MLEAWQAAYNFRQSADCQEPQAIGVARVLGRTPPRVDENGEDYNADFLCILETWEAAFKFLVTTGTKEPKTLELARLLGWTLGLESAAAPVVLAVGRPSCLPEWVFVG